ncbi:MAG: hypothetical protein AAB616_02230 [Patescibacteria group bacterium]
MNFKKRLLINIGIPLGICSLLIAAVVFLGSDITNQINKIEQLQGNLRYYIEMTESLALLRQDSEKAKHYLPELESVLPTRDQLVAFSGDLGIIARQSKVEISSSLGQESPGSEKNLGSIDFTVAGQGEFDNLLNFLTLLKNSRYFIKIKTLDFGRQDGNFKASLTGQVFSF